MKHICFSLLSLFTINALGNPLLCKSDQADVPYSITIHADQTSAEVRIHKRLHSFGTLTCHPMSSENKHELLLCWTDGVFDAGFNAVLSKTEEGRLTIDLSQSSFGGAETLASLDCAEKSAEEIEQFNTPEDSGPFSSFGGRW